MFELFWENKWSNQANPTFKSWDWNWQFVGKREEMENELKHETHLILVHKYLIHNKSRYESSFTVTT